jgi:hypothetical protein
MMFLIAFSGMILSGCDDSREVKNAGELRTAWFNEAVERLCIRYGDMNVLQNTAGIESAVIKRTSVIVDSSAGRIVELNGRKYLQSRIKTGEEEIHAALEISGELEKKFQNYHYSEMLSVIKIDQISQSERIFSVSGVDDELFIAAPAEKFKTGRLIDFEEIPSLYHFQHIQNQRKKTGPWPLFFTSQLKRGQIS